MKRVSKAEWLQTALNLLDEEGVEAIRVERLARELGISKSGFYWHFKDRDDLRSQILDYWVHEFNEVVTANPTLQEGGESMGLIIDTSAIVELERSKSNWDAVLKKAGDEPVFLPAIVWGELMAGVHLADSAPRALRRREKLDALRKAVPILPFTAEIAEVWSRLFAELQRAGTPIPSNDLCVAATAIAEGHRILVSTKDENHYRQVKGAEIVRL